MVYLKIAVMEEWSVMSTGIEGYKMIWWYTDHSLKSSSFYWVHGYILQKPI